MQSEIRRRAVTLIELMVAVAILSIMIGAFSLIVSESQKVVSSSSARMRSNQAAGAVAQVLRDDMRQVSKNGFFCITMNGGLPRMMFITAGLTYSITSSAKGTGTLTCYGLVDNQADGTTDNILWRQGWVLDSTGAPQDDKWGIDLATLQSLPRYLLGGDNDINDKINFIATNSPSSIMVPPQTLVDINALWQCLSAGCNALSIMWTDGTINQNGTPADPSDDYLDWYGIKDGTIVDKMEFPGELPGDDSWKTRNVNDKRPDNTYYIQFSEGGNYRALWTKDNQANWPKAIKVRFSLAGPQWGSALPEGVDYEVICPVGAQ